jgi:hypothetical protein
MFNRIIGTFRLDRRLFEEIEHSEDASLQAFIIVLVISLVSSFGNALGAQSAHRPFLPQFIGSFIWSFCGWIVWAVVSFYIGKIFFKSQGDLAGMVRGIGFSYLPQVLAVIPCLGAMTGLVWSLVAGFIATRQGLKLDSAKTLFTIVIGFGLYLAGHTILSSTLGGLLWSVSL